LRPKFPIDLNVGKLVMRHELDRLLWEATP